MSPLCDGELQAVGGAASGGHVQTLDPEEGASLVSWGSMAPRVREKRAKGRVV